MTDLSAAKAAEVQARAERIRIEIELGIAEEQQLDREKRCRKLGGHVFVDHLIPSKLFVTARKCLSCDLVERLCGYTNFERMPLQERE